MTRFEDGPAAGVTLLLRRAPLYLRAVRAADGKWDALDQLTDYAHDDETIAVYRREGEPRLLHINRSPRAGGSGFFEGGSYRFVDPPPSDSAVRDTKSWREWATAHGRECG